MRFSDYPRFLLGDFTAAGEVFHLHRACWQAPPPPIPHRHDFAEVFWVLGGEGNHWVNGGEQHLRPGALVAIRPWDCHRFHPERGQGLDFMNLAFPRHLLERLQREHSGDAAGRFPWRKGPLPRLYLLQREEAGRLGQYVDDFLDDRRCGLGLSAFLKALCRLLARNEGNEELHDRVPDWLRRAMVEIHRPEHFRGGVAEFGRLAGRSPEHLSRELVRLTGERPSELVRRARLRWAERELAMTDRTVAAIANDCGFESASHFHALFRKAKGRTPAQFRRSIQGAGAEKMGRGCASS